MGRSVIVTGGMNAIEGEWWDWVDEKRKDRWEATYCYMDID
jgi:hypothetical protein